jgi:hypothetical protein
MSDTEQIEILKEARISTYGDFTMNNALFVVDSWESDQNEMYESFNIIQNGAITIGSRIDTLKSDYNLLGTNIDGKPLFT